MVRVDTDGPGYLIDCVYAGVVEDGLRGGWLIPREKFESDPYRYLAELTAGWLVYRAAYDSRMHELLYGEGTDTPNGIVRHG